MLDQGVWAEVKVGGEQLRLFSEESALAVQESVHNIMQGTGLRLRNCGAIERGKDRAAEHARGVPLEGRQPRTTLVNMEEIPLGVVSASLIQALSNPANQFFSGVPVLVRQVAVSLKEITRYRDVASAFIVTLWNFN